MHLQQADALTQCPQLVMFVRFFPYSRLRWPFTTRIVTWSSVSLDGLRDQDFSLLWRHNRRKGVSNHQPHDCLLNRPFSRRSKKTSKLRVTGLCAGNSPVTGANDQWRGKCFHLITSSCRGFSRRSAYVHVRTTSPNPEVIKRTVPLKPCASWKHILEHRS